MNEGELSGRLGLAGWPAVAEEAIIARDCLLAAHVGSRLHVCHVSTAGSVEIVRQAKAQGLERHRRGLPAPPAADRRAGGDVRPDLQGQPAAALGRRRRGAARRAGRRHHRHRRHRPRAAPARGQGLRVGGGRVRDARPRDRALDRAGDDGRHRPARLGRRRRADVVRPGPDRPGRRPRPPARGRAQPANVVLYDPAVRRVVDAAESASLSRNTPYAGMELPGRVVATFLRGQATVLDGKLRSDGVAGSASCTESGACLVLEDGRTFRGEAYGADGETFGEAVFTTGMTGYQETLTDPSYHRQVVVMTAPHIGNTGMNDEDPESVADLGGRLRRPRPGPGRRPAGARGARLDDELRDQGVVGISRRRHPRADPAPARARRDAGRDLLDRDATPDALLARVRRSPREMTGADLADEVSTRRAVRRAGASASSGSPSPRSTSASRRDTPRMMAERGIEVHVLPATATLDDVLRDRRRTGCSSPTDPATRRPPTGQVELLRGALARGHARTSGSASATSSSAGRSGFGTYKLKYGHRGINQPVMDRTTGKVEVTAHNHGFAVDAPLDGADRDAVRRRRRSATSASTTTSSRVSSCATTRAADGVLGAVPPRGGRRPARRGVPLRPLRRAHDRAKASA